MGRRYNRRREYSSRNERKINHREWFTFEEQKNIDPANSTSVQLNHLTFMSLKSDDCTVLRVRGLVEIVPTSIPAAVSMCLGMTILPARYSSETSTLPNPLNQGDTNDWFVWQPLPVQGRGGVEAQHQVIDSKAMRRVEADEGASVVLGFRASPAFGSDDRFGVAITLRLLVGF